jgi:carboxymethylenebutenolidase
MLVAKDANEANHLMTGLNFKAAVDEAKIWVDYLKSERKCKKVGATGFCMGGALSLACASVMGDNLGGISVFYGIPDLSVFPVTTMTCPILLNFGKKDTSGFSDPTAVKKLTEQLRKADKVFQLDWYDAGHAFMNENRPECYREAAAREAFTETCAFFQRNLS